MSVRMELSRILIRELVDHQIIELRETSESESGGADLPAFEDSARRFPIVIGLPEAQAIERRLKGITIKRPQTHDLLANVIERLGGELESICINDRAEPGPNLYLTGFVASAYSPVPGIRATARRL